MTTHTREHAAASASGAPTAGPLATDALAAELRDAIQGEVRFDDGSRALYATDASNYRQLPIGVVIPRDVDDIVKTVAISRRYGAPVLPRGGGTSLAGQCCNVAVVIDCSKYLRTVLEVDPTNKRARVQPGTVLDDLRNAAEHFHLTFGPDPATHDHNTLGGMIGNNSCGVHSIMAGRTVENVESLEILTYDGLRMRVGPTSDQELEQIIRQGDRRAEIYRGLRDLRDRYTDQIRQRYPHYLRWVSGYNLPALLPENGFDVAKALVGTEGTCVTVLEATVRLVESPPGRALLVLGYQDIYTAGDHVPEVMGHQPIGLEALDRRLIGYLRLKNLHVDSIGLLPPGDGWLLVEFGGDDDAAAEARAREVLQALEHSDRPPQTRLYTERATQTRLWKVREAGLGATAYVPGHADTWPGWEDSSVPPEKLGDYLRDLRKLFDRYGYECSLYGHFGQGCVHVRIDFDVQTPRGIDKFHRFLEDATDLVLRYDGSFSAEHGDGQARAEFLPKMYGPELVQAFGEFKALWDPDGKMNPGKVVDPYRATDNLRLGADYAPLKPKTYFSFAQDRYDFSHATLRCVGVGECRRERGGTMCPSFMATKEEKHSTRGRARLLFEMLQGEAIQDGWRSEPVKEALDLCLACKGCKGDCPVNVDLATYKAEFLAHYYAGRLRPRSAYAFGLIMYWARLASLAPRVANFFTQTPLLGNLARTVAGMAPERRIPPFAPRTFKSWFRERGPRNQDRPKLVLWPDTFNNHFMPWTAEAAVEVLEAAGFRVMVPPMALCCGRPFYDYGLLGLAQRHLRQILEALRPQIRAGIPIVGLEPSCVSVFRDELVNLFPHDEDARRLSQQVLLLSEFLEQEAPDFRPPPLTGKRALVQVHCHHQAVLGMQPELDLLGKLGLEVERPELGCCGMAGSFGFEQGDRYDVSVKIGERDLLPAVRQAASETLLIADGFSCREQILQGGGRRPLHLAEVLKLALESGQTDQRGRHDGRGEHRGLQR